MFNYFNFTSKLCFNMFYCYLLFIFIYLLQKSIQTLVLALAQRNFRKIIPNFFPLIENNERKEYESYAFISNYKCVN